MPADPRYDPARDYPDLVFDDTLAICPPATFNALMEYSASAPTGVYDGKVWKGQQRGVWYLGSYEPAPERPGYSVRKYRPLKVVHSRTVNCPYCIRHSHQMEVADDFDPEIEAMHCDIRGLPFDVLIHDDGTLEVIDQDDPRFVV